MGSSVVGKLIGIITLVILSFIIGIMAADSTKSAAMIIAAIGGIAVTVAMGKNVWMLLFILIPFGQAVPVFPYVPIYLFYTIPILVYWCILVVTGNAKFTWRKLLGADIIIVIFLIYMATSIYRFPALDHISASFFGLKLSYLNTNFEYLICALFIIFYITFSCIPFEKKHLYTVIKWGIVIKLVFLFVVACFDFRDMSEVATEALSSHGGREGRIGMFTAFALNLSVFVYASAPIQKLIQSPKAIVAIFLSLMLVLISGYRNRLARLGLVLIGTSVIKKEYTGLLFAIFIGLLATLSINSRETLSRLPYTAQRVLSVLPWMDVSDAIRNNGKGSSEWRYTIWRWALDSRTGFIKNYVLGDGCVMDSAQRHRVFRAKVRKENSMGHQEDAAHARSWHGGFISILQEIGVIGLTISFLALYYALYTTIRIGTALRNTKYLKYYLVYTYPFLQNFITFYILPASTKELILALARFSFLKVFHSIAVEEGLIKLDRNNRKYIPLLIQQEVA